MNSVLSAMAGGKVFSGDADSGVVVYCGGCSIKGRRPDHTYTYTHTHADSQLLIQFGLFRMGCHRVMGMLAMSRALGDVMIEQYLSQEPDVAEQQVRAQYAGTSWV